MAKQDFTPHQQKIIKRYYENIDQISLQRLAELAGELYLAEGKKRDKLWLSAAACMEKLGVPKARIDHVVKEKSPVLVANLVKELMGKVD